MKLKDFIKTDEYLLIDTIVNSKMSFPEENED